MIVRIGDLSLALGDKLESLEINPLVVEGAEIMALDALVTWNESERRRDSGKVGEPSQ